MKKLLLILIVPFLSFAQNQNNEEYYKNGNLKYKKITATKGDVIKEYYKNGQLKYQKNDAQKMIEKYYKNGQLSYRKINNNNTKKEEFYDRDGSLTIQTINDVLTFSIYEYGVQENLKHEDSHDHHGHSHGHDHQH